MLDIIKSACSFYSLVKTDYVDKCVISVMMQSANDDCTPPGTPPKKRRLSKRGRRRRSPSSSSTSSSEPVPRKSSKVSRLSTKQMLQLFENWKEVNKTSSSMFSNNNLNNVVPEFDPSKKTQTIECWLKKVNECAVIYGWDEKQTIHFSLQKLVGLAKKMV